MKDTNCTDSNPHVSRISPSNIQCGLKSREMETRKGHTDQRKSRE